MSVSSVVRVGLVTSQDLVSHCDQLPRVEGRASRVSSLIDSSGLLPHLRLVCSRMATWEELAHFHSQDYVQFLRKLSDSEDQEKLEDDAAEYGLDYDCPPMSEMGDICRAVAGSSISAAAALNSGGFDIVINWFGGWHHAQRDSAEGFCYINDIVLGITELRKKFDKILYVDLDVHHGNGVENAFLFSRKVFTFSLHLFETGFYPGSGNSIEVGMGKGKFYSLNVPLKEGIRDENYVKIFKRSFESIIEGFQPDAIVCQCGSDSLFGDPLGGFNLTQNGILNCTQQILTHALNNKRPVIFLGGGGYVKVNAAKLWTLITAQCCRINLDLLSAEIPENDNFFLEYGPSYDFDISPGKRRDQNSEEYLSKILEIIKGHTDSLKAVSLT